MSLDEIDVFDALSDVFLTDDPVAKRWRWDSWLARYVDTDLVEAWRTSECFTGMHATLVCTYGDGDTLWKNPIDYRGEGLWHIPCFKPNGMGVMAVALEREAVEREEDVISKTDAIRRVVPRPPTLEDIVEAMAGRRLQVVTRNALTL